MASFLIFISSLALIISKIALFIYLIYSFSLEIKRRPTEGNYISRQARKIKIPKKDESQVKTEIKKNILRKTTLIWTMSIGELVGYIFLLLSQHPIKYIILEMNAFWLFMGSLLCQILTVLNAWLKRKVNILIRMGFQIGLVIFAVILVNIATSHERRMVNGFLLIIVLAYFFSAIVAIFSMLADALFAKQGIHDFDYNQYSRIVILLSLVVGSGIYFNFYLITF